jgi:hypothetical protein
MKSYLLYGFLLLLLIVMLCNDRVNGFINYVAPYGNPLQKDWWKRADWYHFAFPTFSYWESFENKMDVDDKKREPLMAERSTLFDFPPNTPSPAELYNNQPYHLLGDEFAPPRENETISCVNSRSCYATDFTRLLSKTGNYRQLTNNYKRGHPDSCSAPYQELVLNFYKTDPMDVPQNNTGYSVSEAVSL